MRAAIRSGLFGGGIAFTTTHPEPSFSNSKNPDDLLIKVNSAAINPIDYKLPKVAIGPVFGLDFSGVVEQVGDNVTEFKAGDAVFGQARGTLAEKCVAPAAKVAKKTDALSFTEAAAVPVAYVTGLQGLRIGNVKEGSSVLIIGASGGCGIAALHLAKAMGATRIVAICSGKNGDTVREAGATEVVDYTDESTLNTFFEENRGKIQCVYDAATGSGKGEDYTQRSMPLLSEESGEYIQLNGPAGTWMKRAAGMLPQRQHLLLTDMNKADLQEALSLLEKSGAKPLIEIKSFTEEGVTEGFELLKSRRAKGKIVFDVSSAPK